MKRRKIKRGPAGTLLLDDRWLNQVESWLAATASFCEREFGSKPTIEDLRRLIATVLTAGTVEEWLADGDRLAIEKVTFATTRRPKVPKKLQAGHLLAIPLRKNTFAFARVMTPESPWLVGAIVEIFSQTRPRPRCDRAVRASGRLLRPLVVNPLLVLRVWRVVGFDAGYGVPKDDKLLEFSGAPHGEFRAILPFDRGRIGRRLTTKEFWAMDDDAPDPKTMGLRIAKALRARHR